MDALIDLYLHVYNRSTILHVAWLESKSNGPPPEIANLARPQVLEIISPGLQRHKLTNGIISGLRIITTLVGSFVCVFYLFYTHQSF